MIAIHAIHETSEVRHPKQQRPKENRYPRNHELFFTRELAVINELGDKKVSTICLSRDFQGKPW